MDSTFKFLGFGASVVICSLLAGCSEGTDPVGSGGAAGTGGSTSSTGGGGGAAATSTKLFTFDMDEQGFALNNVAGTVPYTNLAMPAAAPAPTLTWVVKDDGESKSSGSIKIAATYTFWNQSVSAEVTPPDVNGLPIDFTHKTLSARVFIEPEGLSPFGFGETMDAPGGVILFMKSGTNYVWAQAKWVNVTMYGTWVTFKINTDNLDGGQPAGFEPSNVVQLGFQFSSGGGGPTHCPDSADDKTFQGLPTATCPEWAAPLPTVIYIDNITLTAN